MLIQISQDGDEVRLGKSNLSCLRNAAAVLRALGKYMGDAEITGVAADIEGIIGDYSLEKPDKAVADAATDDDE